MKTQPTAVASLVRAAQFAVVAALAALAPTAGAQEGRPPPPPAAAPELPPLPVRDFTCAYDRAGRPRLLIADVLDVPGGRATDLQQRIAQQLAAAVRATFEGRTVRMIGAGESDRFRVDGETIELARRSTGAAAAHIARRARADVVVLLKLTESPSTGSAAAFDLSYEVLDVTMDPPRTLGQDIAFLEYRSATDGTERVRVNRNFAAHVARRVMGEFIDEFGGCDGPSGGARDRAPGDRAPGGDHAGRPTEFSLTVVGDIDDWEIPEIHKRLERFPSIDRVLDHRVSNDVPEFLTRYRRTEVVYRLAAHTEGFDLATDLAAALFLATGKDARVKSSDRSGTVLEVKNPTYSTWIGRESPANREARRALRAAYQRAGSPPAVILVEDVVGKDFKEGVWVSWTWSWWHPHVAWHKADLWKDIGDPRTFAGEAITTAVVDHIANLGIDVIDDLAGIAADMEQAGLITQGQEVRPRDLDAFLRERYGVPLIIRGSGEVTRRLDQVAISYTFRGSDPGTRRTVVNTQTAARVVPQGDLVAGRFTNQIAEELAGQIVDDLLRSWSEAHQRTQIVLADADTLARLDDLRTAIERVDGVAYTSFRALGAHGGVIEVTHQNAGDNIRRTLERDGYAIEQGSTDTRLLLRAMGDR